MIMSTINEVPVTSTQSSHAHIAQARIEEVRAMRDRIPDLVITARHKAGRDALTTYAMAQVLAARPENADLAPHVADMRRALGKRPLRRVAKPAPPPQT